jgi:hypothetical protein
MKAAKTMNCKLCMMERKEILHRMKTDKHKLINDNSDIFARCSCKCRFHKFFRTDSTALRALLTQKKVTLRNIPNSQEYARYSLSQILMTHQPATLNYDPLLTQRRQLRHPLRTPVYLFDNVPGLPPRSPAAIPMPNLELAQVQHHYKYIYLSVEV